MDKRQMDNLMRLVARGDGEAFNRLYEGMKRGVFAFAYAYLGNGADAEDAVQETFLQVKRRAYTYQPGTDARAWILQIAKNKCLDELRRRKTRAQHEAPMREEGVQQSFPLLEEITKCLTDEEKEIVVLHAVWGYKHKEIAKMLQMPLGTVTWKYNEAIKKLRKNQEEDDA